MHSANQRTRSNPKRTGRNHFGHTHRQIGAQQNHMSTRGRGAAGAAATQATTPLEREMEQAKAGTHPRLIAEEKRLAQVKAHRTARAEQLRMYRMRVVDLQLDTERRAAEEAFAREKGIVQNRLVEEVIDRQKRTSKVRLALPVASRASSRVRRGPSGELPRACVAGGQVGAERRDTQDAAAAGRG